MRINNTEFDFSKKTYVMGILNVTPDSFSDGGKFNQLDEARKRVSQIMEEGGAIVDVGGESTRPNHEPVGEEEEISRVVPVIEMIKREFDIPISIDTYKGSVAREAVKAGAGLLNDVWGFKKDPTMASVAAEYQVPCCLMHNRENNHYTNIISDIITDLKESIHIATAAGVVKENIILDPGIGFAKDYQQNLFVMKHLEELSRMGYPILLGTSRKSMIGNALNLPVEDRLEGTLATTVVGIMKNAGHIIRVHDVKENVRVVKMTEAILQVEN